MKCESCGSELKEDERICPNCGASVDIESEKSSPPQPQKSPTPVTPSVNKGQTQTKKGNTALIIVIVILGIFALGSIITVVVLKTVFTNINKEVKKIEPQKSDTPTKKTPKDGDVVKIIKDPTGHKITIVASDISGYQVDLDYLFDQAQLMKKNAKMMDIKDVQNTNATTEQKAAMTSMLKMLNSSSYVSKSEIKKKLEDESYSAEAIKYAMNNSEVDWKEQTKIKILLLLSSGGFSEQGLKDLMLYEKYTESEINEALKDMSVDYYEQAVYKACFLRFTAVKYGSSFKRSAAKEFLDNTDFSKAEVDFAIKAIYDEMD